MGSISTAPNRSCWSPAGQSRKRLCLRRFTIAAGLHLVRSGSRPEFRPSARSQPLLIPFRHWFLFGSTLFIWSSLYFGINAMLDLEIERARVVRALKLADSARLRALQSQLNPHFLFNALNGIAALIRDKDGTAAAAMVDALGDFLRSMLQTIEQSEIVVAEELHFIDQYLQIQRFRLGNRFGPVWWPTPNLSAL
jgi:hypothetical protein